MVKPILFECEPCALFRFSLLLPGQSVVENVVDCCRNRLVDQEQDFNSVVVGLHKDLVHRLRLYQRPCALLNHSETQNTNEKQKNQKDLFERRLASDITVANRGDGGGDEVPGRPVDLALVGVVDAEPLDPVDAVVHLAGLDVPDRDESAGQQVQEVQERTDCRQARVDVLYCDLVALVALFEQLGEHLKEPDDFFNFGHSEDLEWIQDHYGLHCDYEGHTGQQILDHVCLEVLQRYDFDVLFPLGSVLDGWV